MSKVLVVLETDEHVAFPHAVALLDPDPLDLADHLRRHLDFVRGDDVPCSVQNDLIGGT